MSRELALFDFDGTLTTRDTMFVYLRHVAGPVRLFAAIAVLSPVLVGMKLGLVDNAWAKQLLLRLLLGGRSRSDLESAATALVPTLDALCRPEGIERLHWHLHQGHTVRIVSASLDLWVGPWAAAHGVELLATPAGWREERFTGLGGVNCNHEEKVRRIDAALDRGDFDVVHAYGDTSGDRPMLAIADRPHFQPFRGA